MSFPGGFMCDKKRSAEARTEDSEEALGAVMQMTAVAEVIPGPRPDENEQEDGQA